MLGVFIFMSFIRINVIVFFLKETKMMDVWLLVPIFWSLHRNWFSNLHTAMLTAICHCIQCRRATIVACFVTGAFRNLVFKFQVSEICIEMTEYDLWQNFAYYSLRYKTWYDIASQKNELMMSTGLDLHCALREQNAVHVPEYLRNQGM